MEWISVKDRLPENENTVWGYDAFYCEQVSTYFEDGKWNYALDFGKWRGSAIITHWKLLPKSPKEG